jgi:hypothetical protein
MNNKEKTNKLYYGTLTETYMGYKKGAKIYFYDLQGCDFALAYDIDDTHWGYIFSNGDSPEMDIEREVINVNSEIFFTYYKLISGKVLIPTSFDLFTL